MPSEFKFNNRDEWVMVAVKRDWVPEWLYRLYSYLPSWLQPFQWIFNRKVNNNE